MKPVIIIAIFFSILLVTVTMATVFILVVIIPEYEIIDNEIIECENAILQYYEYWGNECLDNFDEHGYRTAEECHTQRIALYDPVPCL